MSAHSHHIASIRKDYTLAALDEQAAGDDPIAFFHAWFKEAQVAEITEVNAMTLATVDAAGHPHARTVLLKGVENDAFVFYTNYKSAKGHEIAAQPHVSLLFFWKELERQVRIEGVAEKLSAEESDHYFHSRPEGSRIGAWASPQSQAIADRQELEGFFKRYEEQFRSGNIPRPAHWGGYRVVPSHIEFWQGRSSRLHDRIMFTYDGEGKWRKGRLAP